METFDTNVVLRIVYRDDPEQADRAAQVWRNAIDSGGVFLPITVLVELSWVLRVAGKFERAAVVSALKNLCDSQGVMIEQEERVRRALARFELGAADFSDYLVLETARDAAALPVLTFDKRFSRDANVVLVASSEGEEA